MVGFEAVRRSQRQTILKTSALHLDHLLEASERPATGQFRCQLLERVFVVEGFAGCNQQFARQAESNLCQRTVALPVKNFQRLMDLARVASHAPERLMHVGQQRACRQVCRLADADVARVRLERRAKNMKALLERSAADGYTGFASVRAGEAFGEVKPLA